MSAGYPYRAGNQIDWINHATMPRTVLGAKASSARNPCLAISSRIIERKNVLSVNYVGSGGRALNQVKLRRVDGQQVQAQQRFEFMHQLARRFHLMNEIR
jgi:hypothetical protein